MTRDQSRRRAGSALITRVAKDFALQPSDNLVPSIREALAALGELISAQRVAIGLVSADSESLEIVHQWSAHGEPFSTPPDAHHPRRRLSPVEQRGLEAGQPVFGSGAELATASGAPEGWTGAAEMMAVPGRWAEGLTGVLSVGFGRSGQDCDELLALLDPFCALLGSALVRAHTRFQFAHQDERYRALIQNTSDLVIVHDSHGIITFAGPSIERILGWPATEVVGTNVVKLIHRDDLAAGKQLEEAPAGPQVVRVRHRNGTWRFIETLTSALANEVNTGEFLSNGRDVTDRVAAEEALREQQAVDALLCGISSRFVRDGSRGFEANLLHSIEEVREFFGLDRVGIWRSPAANGLMSVSHEVAGRGLTIIANRVPRLTPADIAALAPGVMDGEVVVCHDHFDPYGLLASITVPDARPMRSFVLVPMLTDGRLIGFLNLVSLETSIAFTPEAVSVLASVGSIFTSAMARHESDQALARQALHDPLTGLANRALIMDRLDQATARARRSGGSLALLFIDLDGFKGINDSLGHAAGDELLVGVAHRLMGACRATDTVARLGGDEFVVLFEGSMTTELAQILADRVQAVVSEPMRLAGHDVHVACSIGIVVEEVGQAAPGIGGPRPHGTAREGAALLRKADIAMYKAKQRGQNSSELFNPEMEARARQRFELIDDMRDVAFETALRLCYQPVVWLDDLSVSGLEALVRWEHPTRGLLAPGAFIELAEQTNTIHALGAWVMDTSFAQLATWQAEGKVGPRSFRLAVNLSPRQLQDPALPHVVASALERHRVDPRSVVFELTESSYVDRHEILSRLLQLREIGVKLSIDDFGTGYSSLAHIRDLPVDELKIDRSFVQGLGVDPRDCAVVKAILGMADALGLSVVAEGVETELQLDALMALGCKQAQGYLLGRPMPTAEVDFRPVLTH